MFTWLVQVEKLERDPRRNPPRPLLLVGQIIIVLGDDDRTPLRVGGVVGVEDVLRGGEGDGGHGFGTPNPHHAGFGAAEVRVRDCVQSEH